MSMMVLFSFTLVGQLPSQAIDSLPPTAIVVLLAGPRALNSSSSKSITFFLSMSATIRKEKLLLETVIFGEKKY